MPRSIRCTVFLSQEEHDLIASVTPDDTSIGATLRRLAIKQAQWFAQNSRKFHGPTPQTHHQRNPISSTEPYLDRSSAQPEPTGPDW